MTRKPTEMELRVARALRQCEWADSKAWSNLNEISYFEKAASAAIRAMRYPTAEMMDAGSKESIFGLPDAWLAMIDAASPELMP